MNWILEINDCALSLYHDTALVSQGPAIALVQPSEIQFGDQALRQARIHPRQANQQYLARLNADPLPHPVPKATNHADLVFLHLQQFISAVADSQEDLLIAVPGFVSNDQLGVLLGIIQETGARVSGFVDAATVATTRASVQSHTHHIDLHLQRTCITALSVGDDIQALGTQEIPESGLSNLLDSWVNVIADQFVRDTRFDPLHAAETEQQLYDQVYDWIAGPGAATAAPPAAEISIDIEYQDHIRHVEIPRSLLETKAQQRYQRIIDALPESGHATLSSRTARLPGLHDALDNVGIEVCILTDQALAEGCIEHMPAIRSSAGKLRLVTKLPYGRPIPPGHPAGTVPRAPAPTHILNCHTAIAIPINAQSTLPLGLAKKSSGVFIENPNAGIAVNGEAATNARLSNGDEISHGDSRYLLITVDQ